MAKLRSTSLVDELQAQYRIKMGAMLLVGWASRVDLRWLTDASATDHASKFETFCPDMVLARMAKGSKSKYSR
eukprot:2875764-Alexandrium_andersonii.AAC.1